MSAASQCKMSRRCLCSQGTSLDLLAPLWYGMSEVVEFRDCDVGSYIEKSYSAVLRGFEKSYSAVLRSLQRKCLQAQKHGDETDAKD